MQTHPCRCGNLLFFENSHCLTCGRTVGRCPACTRIVPLESDGNATRCGNEECGAELVQCRNFAVEAVCNWFVEPTAGGPEQPLCRSCELTNVIPDLSIDGNRERWGELEAAKRRVLHQLESLDVPYGNATQPPLRFEFKADADFGTGEGAWRSSGSGVVQTGHSDGLVTINVAEADAVTREQVRVRFGEDHRTLVGHFRHELAHYFWDTLIRDQDEANFVEVFGDHTNPTYAAALGRHHAEGPPPDWSSRFVSAYASMHPWEDFAETFAKYLEIRAVLGTAVHFGLIDRIDDGMGDTGVSSLVDAYESVGLITNELNRDLGLADLDPRPIVDAVRPKVEYVHALVSNAAAVPA